jgi:DHA2 family multidrug resistance protein
MVIGMMLYGTSYVIPQFLATIAGYNSLQSGKIVLLSGIPSLLMMPITPLAAASSISASRSALAWLLIMAQLRPCWTPPHRPESTGGDFVDSQLLRGVGTIIGHAVPQPGGDPSVTREDAGDAAGLFNAVRNLGGSPSHWPASRSSRISA